jgi:hypothetical protein
MGFLLDYLFAVWRILPGLGCVASVFTASVSWRSFFKSRKMPLARVLRGLLARCRVTNGYAMCSRAIAKKSAAMDA